MNMKKIYKTPLTAEVNIIEDKMMMLDFTSSPADPDIPVDANERGRGSNNVEDDDDDFIDDITWGDLW